MFDGVPGFVLTVGFCFIVFSVAHMLHILAMFLEDNEKPDFVVYPIAFVCFFLYFCVLPFTGFVYLLFHYQRSRANKISYQDGQDSMKPIMETEIRIAVQKENDRMRKVMESALDQQRSELSDSYKKKLQKELELERSSLLWEILRKNPPSSVSDSSNPPQHRTYAHADDGTLIEL